MHVVSTSTHAHKHSIHKDTACMQVVNQWELIMLNNKAAFPLATVVVKVCVYVCVCMCVYVCMHVYVC